MKKLLALLLCVAMLLSFAACGNAPEPTETSSNEELARDMYAQARKPLDEATSLTLNLEIRTTTEVAGSTISRQSNQTLTYQEMGTDHAVIAMEDQIAYGVHLNEDLDKSDYTEIWYQDTLYVKLLDGYRFSGSVSAEDAAARYTPAVLLDASLYGSVTYEDTNGGTKVFFAQPTAAESWAMPEDAELQKASGTALLDETGALSRMDYTITYTYGSATVTTTVQSQPAAAVKTVSPPEKTDLYLPLTDVDAVLMMQDALMNVCLAESVTYSSSESLISQAAAIMQNENYQMYTHGLWENMKLKLENSYYFYSTDDSQETKMEQTYLDGKLTTENDGSLPSTTTMDWEIVADFSLGMLTDNVPNPDYWQDATVTDLGSLYFIELELNENFGNTTQNWISQSLWEDPSFLLNLSSEYKNSELSGYLSVDKYTGMPVAAGYYYEGVHTIEGQDYTLSLQYDQSTETPSKGAYKEITGEMLPEAEPENKATPLFYHVTGADGQEMWLLGTIHVGDERTAYLPQEIKDAFAASDALAIECNTELFDQLVEEDATLAALVSALYLYTDGSSVETLMEEEEYDLALKTIKAVGGYNMNMPYFKASIWSEIIENFYLNQGYQLHRDQGVEEHLTTWAEEQGKEILEVESSLFQLQMSTSWSNDLQVWMLQDSISLNGSDYWQSTWELYELWCAGDEAAMREELSSQVDTSEWTEEEIEKYLPLTQEYNKAMSHDRNDGMLEVAIDYLESGKVIFYAVGLAHLLDDTNGLVDTLRDAGYTVELVSYAN